MSPSRPLPPQPTSVAKLGGGRIEGWDMLRGVGMSLIVLVHALDASGLRGHQGWGIVPLTSFFVLSGYLITGLLLRDINRHGQIRLGVFYRNRAVRLLPPLMVVLVAYAVAETLIDRTSDPVWVTALIGMFYVGNLPGFRELTGTMRQMWSLAFEEQFYFVWPTLLWWTVRRRIATHVTLLLCMGAVGALLITAFMSTARPERIYTLPTTWAAPVLIGCLAALHRDRARALVRPASRAGLPLLGVAAIVALWCCVTWEFTEIAMYLGGPFIAGLACLVIVLWLEEWSVVRSRWLRPIVGLGTVSYAAYLWNYPLVMYVHHYVEDVPSQILLSTVLTVLMAVLSWYLVEKPTQRWRARVTSRTASPAARETAPA